MLSVQYGSHADNRPYIKDFLVSRRQQGRTDSFRAVALALRFGCKLENIGKKCAANPDLLPEHVYHGKGVFTGIHTGIEKFRKCVKIVCCMIRVITAFYKNASDIGRPVLVGKLEYNRENLTVPSHPLQFNPKQFSVKKHKFTMEPAIREILKKPWSWRTEEEVERVWFGLRHVKEYRNMTNAMQLTMAKYSRFEMHGLNRTIVRKGDPGRHYYFIYSGQVELRHSTVETDHFSVLKAGSDFGDMALLHDVQRSASIVCTEDTEFVVLDRRGNGRAVYKTLLAEHKRKVTILKSLELFKGKKDDEYQTLAHHSRISQYLPTSLVATVDNQHQFIYIIIKGIANVALITDVYSCCEMEKAKIEQCLQLYQRDKCRHKSEVLHDVFTRQDPQLSLVIQQLKERHIFGMQHMLHSTSSSIPQLHLIAKSMLTVLRVPVSSVQHFAPPLSLYIAKEKYPLYPSIKYMVRRYMEDSIWELYKAHLVRDLLHVKGRVDPGKRCKYCLFCQLRSLMVPSVIPDPVRDEVQALYCPGTASPLPAIAQQTFRPASAPPLSSPPRAHTSSRSRGCSPSPGYNHRSSTPSGTKMPGPYPLFWGSPYQRATKFRPSSPACGVSFADPTEPTPTAPNSQNSSRPGTPNRNNNSRPCTARQRSRPTTTVGFRETRPTTSGGSRGDRPQTSVSRSTTSVSRSTTSVSRSTTSVSRSTTAVTRPTTSVSRPKTSRSSRTTHSVTPDLSKPLMNRPKTDRR